MEMIAKDEIKQGMLWGDKIKSEDFEECYQLILSDKTINDAFTVHNQDFVIGRWQLDSNLNIIELAKTIALNSKTSKKAGTNSNEFGKGIYEKLVRNILSDNMWDVVPTSIRIKYQQKINTDIDLIANNNGTVLIGQIKFANSGRNRYDIWKARQSIIKAITQIKQSLMKIETDKKLLYSILKRFGFSLQRNDIKRIVPIVITSSSYFIGEYEKTNIPVVSWDMFCQIIHFANSNGTVGELGSYFANINSLYDFDIPDMLIQSEIDQDEYNIKYEEFITD